MFTRWAAILTMVLLGSNGGIGFTCRSFALQLAAWRGACGADSGALAGPSALYWLTQGMAARALSRWRLAQRFTFRAAVAHQCFIEAGASHAAYRLGTASGTGTARLVGKFTARGRACCLAYGMTHGIIAEPAAFGHAIGAEQQQ
jgi:hypothetical protein